MWRLGGIFRDAYLWSAPIVHVRDVSVNVNLDSTYTDGLLTIDVWIKNEATVRWGVECTFELLDAQGKPVVQNQTSVR